MPDEYGNPTADEQNAQQQDNEVIRTLREQANGATAARAEAEAARRELAFVKAGIDPDDPQQGYFVRGYQGDVTADAIRAAAETAGFLGGQTTTSDQGMTATERQAFANTASAAAGSTVAAPPPTDIFADLRGIDPRRSGIQADAFGMMIAERIQAAGGDVAYEGPQSRIQANPNTPILGNPFPR